MDLLFYIGILLFVLSTCLFLLSINKHKGKLQSIAYYSLDCALLFWFSTLFYWSFYFASTAPNRFFLGVVAGGVSLLYRFSFRYYQWHSLGSVVTSITTILAIFSLISSQPLHLNELSHQWLLLVHISLAMIGLTAFIITAIISGFYVLQSHRLKNKKSMMRFHKYTGPPLNLLDQISLKGLLIGFPFYTLALLVGSAQAFQLETGVHSSYIIALISWLIFGVILQARLMIGWRGQKSAWLTLTATSGVFFVMVNYTMRSV